MCVVLEVAGLLVVVAVALSAGLAHALVPTTMRVTRVVHSAHGPAGRCATTGWFHTHLPVTHGPAWTMDQTGLDAGSDPNAAAYSFGVITIIPPAVGWHRELLDFLDSYDSARVDGLSVADEAVATLADPLAFAGWVAEQLDHEAGRNLPPGRVACTSRWIVDDGVIVGVINLRHELTDYLFEQGGHIGYAVRPSARGHGVATAALRQMLGVAAQLGINPLLVTCADGNLASAQVILKAGGVFEDIRAGMRRYWITLPGRIPA
ncbi:MAG: hypothetical protein CSA84_03990 [Actinomycetales bacterium]|nr:MAG: hypothetical protein CSA84_03990 [Actinomycetales bacterium]